MLAFAVVLVSLRLLAAHFGELTEGDEILIAEGIATIRNGSLGPIYRYGPQLGYYRIVLWLTGLFGDIGRAPVVMVLLSALAGILIPILGLFAFRDELSARVRVLLAVLLTFNPALWTAATYGNTAMPSVALICLSFVILSNRPDRIGELAALGAFAVAIVMRADAVLTTGALGLLLWRNHGRFVPAFFRVASVGLALLLLYGLLFAADPLMAGTFATVGDHLTNTFPTLFWDFLLWAFSPIPLAFAILGLREMEPKHRWLLATVAAWVLPIFLFYFGNTTTPRYHLQAVFPLTLAAALGVWSAVDLFASYRRLATVAAIGLACLHAFVAVGRFVPAESRSWLHGGSVPTHDGEFSTGAFLYKTFIWNRPDIRTHLTTRYELPESVRRWTEELETARYAGRHVIVVADGVYSPLLHWAAEFKNARVTSYHAEATNNCHEFELAMHGARVTTTDLPRMRKNSNCRIEAEAGDELWIVRPRADAAVDLPQAHLTAGLSLERIPGDDPHLRRFRVIAPS